MEASELLKRKQEWLEKLKREGKLKDPTEDHKIGLIALQNRIRREIIIVLSKTIYTKNNNQIYGQKTSLRSGEASTTRRTR